MKRELRNAGVVSLTLGALGCGEPAQPEAVLPQNLFWKDTVATDSLQGEGWRKFLDAKTLHAAWVPPASSPWRPYYKPTLIAAVTVVQSAAMPVRNESLAKQESEAIRFAKSLDFRDVAVFIDLPGEQSVTWGAALRSAGVQPIVMFNNWPHQYGLLQLERPLGALIYFAEAMAKSPAIENPTPGFILERSRLGQKGLDPSPRQFDNRFFHPSTDFPAATRLTGAGIRRIVYVNPRGTYAGCEEDDLNEYFTELASHGLQFTYVKAGAEPYELAIVVPASRSTIFTKENLVQYASSPQYYPHYYHSYPHYHYWHTNYWTRSSGAWGGSGASSGSGSGFSS